MAEKVSLQIVKGKDLGKKTTLNAGFCKVLGRKIDLAHLEADRTAVVQSSMALRKEESDKLNSFLAANALEAPKSGDAPPFKRSQDFILDDEQISRLHAMLFSNGEIVGVIDLASTNGTKVNNRRIEVAKLEDQDIIQIGDSLIQCVFLDNEP